MAPVLGSGPVGMGGCGGSSPRNFGGELLLPRYSQYFMMVLCVHVFFHNASVYRELHSWCLLCDGGLIKVVPIGVVWLFNALICILFTEL